MRSEALAERVARFVTRPESDDFGALAVALARELYEADPAFRELCSKHGSSGPPTDWRAIPAAAAATDEPGELGLEAADRAFQNACLARGGPTSVLEIAPGVERAARLLDRFGAPGSASASAGERIDVGAARSWLAGRQRDRVAALLLTTRESLERLLGTIERQDLRFQLSPGSLVVVTAAQAPAPALAGLAERCRERLGVAPGGLLAELSWKGVPTPLLGRVASDGGLDAMPSPWVRVRALVSDRPEDACDAEGALSVLDLTIARGSPHVSTRTRGRSSAGRVTIPPT